MEVHVVTPSEVNSDQIIAVATDIHPYVTAIHIRQKSWSESQVEQLIVQLLRQGISASQLIVNTHQSLALRWGLGGVHLPEHVDIEVQNEMLIHTRSNLRTGRSVHSLERAVIAEREGCDYVFFGHVYDTASKPDIPPRGVQSLQSLCSQLSIPVIAIGGIKPHHISELARVGVAGIAVMSGIFESRHPLSQLQLYREQFHSAEQLNR